MRTDAATEGQLLGRLRLWVQSRARARAECLRARERVRLGDKTHEYNRVYGRAGQLQPEAG